MQKDTNQYLQERNIVHLVIGGTLDVQFVVGVIAVLNVMVISFFKKLLKQVIIMVRFSVNA